MAADRTHDLRAEIARAMVAAGIGDDEGADLFEWHPCCDRDNCGGRHDAAKPSPCPCAGRPYLSDAAWSAIAGAAALAGGWPADDPPAGPDPEPDPEPDDPRPTRRWVHGTHLGRSHTSVRTHLVEDHGLSVHQVDALSDGAVHGLHDGRHDRTWAYAYDLPHGERYQWTSGG